MGIKLAAFLKYFIKEAYGGLAGLPAAYMLSEVFDKYRLIFSSFARFFQFLLWHVYFLPDTDTYWSQIKSFSFEGSYTYIPSLLSSTLIFVNFSF